MAKGLCSKCNKNLDEKNCGYCSPCKSAYGVEWRRKKLASEPGYRERKNKEAAISRSKHRDKINERQKLERRLARVQVLEHYGSVCVCCGVTDFEFLAIDHVNGGGRQHYKQVGDLVRWILKNDYPEGFRILCHNCNQALGFYGACPHAISISV